MLNSSFRCTGQFGVDQPNRVLDHSLFTGMMRMAQIGFTPQTLGHARVKVVLGSIVEGDHLDTQRQALWVQSQTLGAASRVLLDSLP